MPPLLSDPLFGGCSCKRHLKLTHGWTRFPLRKGLMLHMNTAFLGAASERSLKGRPDAASNVARINKLAVVSLHVSRPG